MKEQENFDKEELKEFIDKLNAGAIERSDPDYQFYNSDIGKLCMAVEGLGLANVVKNTPDPHKDVLISAIVNGAPASMVKRMQTGMFSTSLTGVNAVFQICMRNPDLDGLE